MPDRARKLLLVVLVASMVASCKGNEVAPPQGPPLDLVEATSFGLSLTKAMLAAMSACQSKLPAPVGIGTFPLNFSCEATRTCTQGGSIRASLTQTGQMTIGAASVTVNSPQSGSQNILNWGCVGSDIISGNPSVSLAGTVQGNTTVWTMSMRQTGQIIVGQAACTVNLTTTGDTTTAGVRTTGTICDQSIDLVNVTLP